VPHSFIYNTAKIVDYLSGNDDGRVKSILDVGCGNGHIAHLLKCKGYDITGIDDSTQGINLAKEKFPNISFYNISIDDERLSSLFKNKFDLLVAVEVLGHLYDPAILFKVAKNLLKESDSELIIITPYHGYLKNLVMAILGKWPRHLSPNWRGGVIKFFDINQLKNLATNNGFEIKEISTIGRFKYLAKNIFLVCTPPQSS
jgi:2-polyprenyl-3-methyl-5-hydroxy-6-metoxy-1,4-benzoquinol methylase